MAIWFVLFVVAPLSVNIPISLTPIVFILLCYVCFWVGISLSDVLWQKKATLSLPRIISLSMPKARFLFRISIFLAVIAVTFKLYDSVVLRGATLENDAFSNRESIESEGGGLFSMVAAILAGFQFIPYLLYEFLPVKRSKIVLIFVLSLFLFDVAELVLFSSRSGLFLTLMLFAAFQIMLGKVKLNWKTISLSLIGVFALIAFMSYIFLERTKLFAGDLVLQVALIDANYNYTLSGTNDVINTIFYTNSSLLESVSFSIVNATIYYLHGIIEFNYLFENFTSDHAMGQNTFFVFSKFASILFEVPFSQSEVESLAPRGGVFTSFFGPIYIDFGWFSLLFMFYLGWIIKYFYYKLRAVRFHFMPIYGYFIIVVFFFPVFNFISGAQGAYILVSNLIFLMLFITINKVSYHDK